MRAMADTGTLKRLFLILVAAVVVLDAIMIGGYYALHVGMRTMKTQQTYVAVWVVLTLVVVTTMMKRIRAARRRR
jgi:multidrug resistance efflux pump